MDRSLVGLFSARRRSRDKGTLKRNMECSSETAVSMLERWRRIPSKVVCKFRDSETMWELEGAGSILSVSEQVFAVQFASAILSVRFDSCEFSVNDSHQEQIELALTGKENVSFIRSNQLTATIGSGRYSLSIADIIEIESHSDRAIA